MDKYEFKIKTEQLERLVQRKDYKMAAKIADGIDWGKVRNVELLLKVSEVYEHLGRYEDCYEILNMAYERSPIGRTIIYKMSEIATKMGDYDEAIELYKEFVKIAPHDLSRYALKYKIYQAKGAPLTDQIAILEEFKSREYHEKWAYELAVLYYKEGMRAKCVEECDDLVLWFSEGEYVRRALELKMRIQALTASQEEKYRNIMRGDSGEEVPEEEAQEEAAVQEESLQEEPAEPKETVVQKQDTIQVRIIHPEERYNTMNLQAELADELKTVFEDAEEPLKEKQKVVKKPVKPFVPSVPVKTVEPPKAATTFKEVGTLRLGQREDGQLTFNEDENVLERQITGQMTIDEILAEWEVKKKQMEERIARATAAEKEQKEEKEKEQETAKDIPASDIAVPDIMDILAEPEELVEEIAKGEQIAQAEEEELIVQAEEEEFSQEQLFPDLAPEVEDDLPQEVEEEVPQAVEEEAAPEPEEKDTDQEADEIESILLAALAEEQIQAEEKEKAKAEKAKSKPARESQPKASSRKEEAASSMIQDLEQMLVNELKNVSGNNLTEEQEKLFAYFTAVRGMNQQLSQFLEEDSQRVMDGTSVNGNLVVTGEKGTGKTTLAVDMVKAVQKQRGMKGSKMARVAGEDLSKKDVAEVVRKLRGGALVVEQAGGLTTEAAAKLSGAMLGQTDNLFIILEDEPSEIQRLFERCESLGAKFQKTIEIPVFTNNELVAFGKSYAGEQGFVLDEMAVLALYNRIGNNQTSDHLVNVTEVKEMIDDAIHRASRKGLAKLFGKRRTDDFGNYVLLEKDFEE